VSPPELDWIWTHSSPRDSNCPVATERLAALPVDAAGILITLENQTPHHLVARLPFVPSPQLTKALNVNKLVFWVLYVRYFFPLMF